MPRIPLCEAVAFVRDAPLEPSAAVRLLGSAPRDVLSTRNPPEYACPVPFLSPSFADVYRECRRCRSWLRTRPLATRPRLAESQRAAPRSKVSVGSGYVDCLLERLGSSNKCAPPGSRAGASTGQRSHGFLGFHALRARVAVAAVPGRSGRVKPGACAGHRLSLS